jgi:hypothetical protein
MPRPTWDPTRPADSDLVSAFPALHRGDKATLKDIIGTLGPFGDTTTAWRQVQVGDDTWLVQNLYFDGANWNRDDTSKASVALGLRANGTVTVHKVAAGSNPVGSSLPAPVATLDATSLVAALVAGVDPGGTEALRAQTLRAGSATLGELVVDPDPGGTESLRAGSARLNAPVLLGSVPQFTMAADPTAALHVATKQYVDSVGRLQRIAVFTSSDTWTKSAGTRYIVVECIGGGGGGAGGGTDASGAFTGGGGGGGGYALAVVDVTSITSGSVTVGVGGEGGGVGSNGSAGGSSQFSVGGVVYARATGGGGGTYGAAASGLGGSEGNGTVGSVMMDGQPGFGGARALAGGAGGMAARGGGGGRATSSGGTFGKIYGGGGGSGFGATPGGGGARGVVIIWEYS